MTAQTEARAVDDRQMIDALRDRTFSRWESDVQDVMDYEDSLCSQAADRISTLLAALAAKDAELAALKKEAADVVRPFAKAGELFPEPQFDFEQCIYNPAAGPEYALGSSHLRTARSFLNKLERRDG